MLNRTANSSLSHDKFSSILSALWLLRNGMKMSRRPNIDAYFDNCHRKWLACHAIYLLVMLIIQLSQDGRSIWEVISDNGADIKIVSFSHRKIIDFTTPHPPSPAHVCFTAHCGKRSVCFCQILSASGVFCVLLKSKAINNCSYFSQHAEVHEINVRLCMVMGTVMWTRVVLSLKGVLFSDGISVQFN